MSDPSQTCLFEVVSRIEVDKVKDRKRGSKTGDVVSKTYNALIYNLEHPDPRDEFEQTPAIMVFFGPAPNQDPIDIEQIEVLKTFFLENYVSILKHALNNPTEGDSFYDKSGRRYDYTEDRDVLECLAEKLPVKERRQLLSQTKLVGYLPGRRLQ